jgi:16S rRNA processing protein RimM
MNPVTYRYQVLLGKITRTSGYIGAVSVKLESSFIENVPELESVFLLIDGKPVPFFISASEYPGGDILRLRFEGYDTYDKVAEFTNCSVFLTGTYETSDIQKEAGQEISGFKVVSSDRNNIGTIRDIIRNPGQDLIRLDSPEGKEILIPFHRDLILKIEKKKRTLIVNLPEGLTEIN